MPKMISRVASLGMTLSLASIQASHVNEEGSNAGWYGRGRRCRA